MLMFGIGINCDLVNGFLSLFKLGLMLGLLFGYDFRIVCLL